MAIKLRASFDHLHTRRQPKTYSDHCFHNKNVYRCLKIIPHINVNISINAMCRPVVRCGIYTGAVEIKAIVKIYNVLINMLFSLLKEYISG
jgi:hypothetical protein